MFCHRCGAENEDSARFCTRCGVALTKPSVLHRRAPWVRIAAAGLTVVVLVALLVILVRMLWPGPHVAPQPTTTPVSAATFPLPTRVPPAFTDSPSPTAVPPTPTPELGTSNLYLEYIVDASGSMNERLSDGTVKLAVTRKLLTEHLRAFRPETNIGLRAYGHRVDYKQRAESCADIELVAAVEKGQVERIVTWLDSFEAQGMTPLAEAIRGALGDFVSDPARINAVVLLSDGEETCGGDPCKLVEELKAQGVNFTIHVIGLNVDQPTREQLTCIAQQAGGTYHDARGQRDLQDALMEINRALRSTEAITPPQVATPTPMLPTGTNTATMAPSETPVSPTPTSKPEGRIAFISDRDNRPGIYVMNADGSGVEHLVSVRSGARLACSTDGSLFALAIGEGGGRSDIWVVGVDGSGLRNLTMNPDWDWASSWSPDSRRLVYDSVSVEDRRAGIYIINVDGGGNTLLTAEGSSPSWSPDGEYIVFDHKVIEGDRYVGSYVAIISADGGASRMVLDHVASVDRTSSWSPDSRQIAFQTGPAGSGIYIVNADGSNLRRLSDGGDVQPEWSPDGTRIVFERYASGSSEIFIMNVDGSGKANLTKHPASDRYPCWLP